MGKRDSAGKVYFSDAERFADLVNGFCFKGKQVIKAGDLSEKQKAYRRQGSVN